MSKKPNRQGTVYYSESDQVWVAELRWKGLNGESHRKVWKDRKRSVVYASLDDYKHQLAVQGIFDIKNGIAFREFADNWLSVIRPSIKPTTYMRKEVVLRVQVYPYIGNCIINQLSSAAIQNMINSLSQAYSYSTVKKAYEAVNGCISYYNTITKSNNNPCLGVVLPKGSSRDISDISFFDKSGVRLIEEEAGRIKENGAPKYRLGQAIIILLYTGLRVSELLALNWNDVDFEHHTLTVNKNLVQIRDVDGEMTDSRYKLIIQDSTKTKSSNRVIPLNTKAEAAFKSLQAITGADDTVISTINHSLCAPYNISKLFHEIQTYAGIPKERQYGVHSLRHTFASMLYRNGCDTKIVSELLGHSSTKITEDIYIHIIQEQKAIAIDNLDSYLD